jgi:TatA/E family protein of Tat protein translocase
MFDIGLQEMLVIGVLALLVFGPSKLPELGRMVGRAMREFRRASDEFRSTVETNLHINEPDPPPPAPETSASTAAPALPSEAEALAPESQSAAVAVETLPERPEPYCAQRGSRLFHRGDCAWVGRIPAPERTYFMTMAEAGERGLARCPVCEPWEPS